MTISIEELRAEYIDDRYVGFGPNTTSVKPVHIANGIFRSVMGYTCDTTALNRFVFWQKNTGEVPRNHDLDSVYAHLVSNGRLDGAAISKEQLKDLREMLRHVVDADNGVYLHKDRMESYSSGYQSFLSEDRIAQDGGELIAEWLRVIESPLHGAIRDFLSSPEDPVTVLCLPLLSDERKARTRSYERTLSFLFQQDQLPDRSRLLWSNLAESAANLAEHLLVHPNKLHNLRMATLFASFVLVRHLACLESYYVSTAADNIIPILLDFSSEYGQPVARASSMSYTLVCQSMSRFYAWAFAKRLEQLFSLEQLLKENTPTYSRRKKLSPEAEQTWMSAIQQIQTASDPFLICGQALYDAMAQDANANPISYLRKLGWSSGSLWPSNTPSRRFILQQDMLEVLVRGVLKLGESVSISTLQDRLWSHYGIIVGGRATDEEVLLGYGIFQADSTALRENQRDFAERLGKLEFAHMLADGVLQVSLS